MQTAETRITPTTYLSKSILRSFDNQTSSSAQKKTQDFIAKLNSQEEVEYPLPFDDPANQIEVSYASILRLPSPRSEQSSSADKPEEEEEERARSKSHDLQQYKSRWS